MSHYRPKKLTLTYQQYMDNDFSLTKLKIDNYIICEMIGQGSSGKVFRVINDNTNIEMAVKLLDLKMIQKQTNENIKRVKIKLSESQSSLMMICSSENLIKCFDVYENKDLKLMVLEYCCGVSLEDEIKVKRRIPEDQSISLMKQIINGVAELHRRGIIHRDLKADNIISHNGVYKICDFGFSKQMLDPDQEIKQTTLGTPGTMAPEVFHKQPYGIKADIWSIGIIFFQMIFGQLPFKQYSTERIVKQIKYRKIFQIQKYTYKNLTISQQATKFLRQVLTIKSFQRLGWKQLKTHPIFKQPNRLTNQFRIDPQLNLSDIKNEQQEIYYNNQEMSKLIELKPFNQQKVNHVQMEQSEILTITEEQLELKKTQVNNKDHQVFIWVKQKYLQCLKTQLLFNNLVLTLYKNQPTIDLTSRFAIEMLYLLLTRCRNNISIINEQLKTNNHNLVYNLSQNVRKLYHQVDQKWNTCASVLTQIQSKILQMIKDKIIKLVKRQSMVEKDLYLTGVEVCDYTKKQQINFTYENYLSIFEKDLQKIITKYDYSLIEAHKIIQKYIRINEITLQQIHQTQYPFYEYVRKQIIL